MIVTTDVREIPAQMSGRANAQYMGDPDGPMRFIKSLGLEVPTYINDRVDLKTQYRTASAHISIDYHVPPAMRGPYLPIELADYDPDIQYPLTRTLKVRCGGLKPDGQICQKSAMNRTGFCTNHGGALHPADKMFSSERGIMPSAGVASLSRLQMVEMDIIPVRELTDEEITKQQVRNDDGTFSKTTRLLSAKIVGQMRAEFFERADRIVRESTLSLLEEMQRIALSPVEEAKDKIAAIQWLTERALGKTPDVLITNKTDAPFEQLMGDITGGSRDEYRKRTALNDPNVVDGMIVIDDEIEEDDDLRESPQDDIPAAAALQGISQAGISFPAETGGGRPTHHDNASVAQPAPEKPDPAGIARERKEAKERIKKARNRRYAARAVGATSITNLAYEVKFIPAKLGGKDVTRMKLISPEDQKAPKMR